MPKSQLIYLENLRIYFRDFTVIFRTKTIDNYKIMIIIL